jgi:hypothetical protein
VSGAAAKLVAKLKDVSATPSSAGGPGGSPAANGASGQPAQKGADSGGLNAQEKKLIEIRTLLDSASQDGTGGVITAVSTDGQRIALKQTYPRPVAIGFRSVSQQPSPDGIKTSARVVKP